MSPATPSDIIIPSRICVLRKNSCCLQTAGVFQCQSSWTSGLLSGTVRPAASHSARLWLLFYRFCYSFSLPQLNKFIPNVKKYSSGMSTNVNKLARNNKNLLRSLELQPLSHLGEEQSVSGCSLGPVCSGGPQTYWRDKSSLDLFLLLHLSGVRECARVHCCKNKTGSRVSNMTSNPSQMFAQAFSLNPFRPCEGSDKASNSCRRL